MKITRKSSEMIMFLAAQPQDKVWDLTEHKEQRSLTQNAYYWKLAGEVAKKTTQFGVNVNEIHNKNLRELGLLERIDGQIIPIYLPDTDEAEKIALNAEKFHIKPTSQIKVGKNGDVFRCYALLRGSHTFNSGEYSALVELMVQEAKAVGVETLTPKELTAMRLKEQENEQKVKSL